MYNIEIYEDKKGKSEIINYIKSLNESYNKEDRIKLEKITMYLQLLSEKGLTLREPYIKKLDKEMWELRPLRDRILFSYHNNDTFILLSLFQKKTQKTPRREISKAKRILKDYKKRRESNE